MNNLDIEPKSGTEQIQTPEARPGNETELIQAAELLETPPDGSFVMGLQAFVAWVNTLLADDSK